MSLCSASFFNLAWISSWIRKWTVPNFVGLGLTPRDFLVAGEMKVGSVMFSVSMLFSCCVTLLVYHRTRIVDKNIERVLCSVFLG